MDISLPHPVYTGPIIHSTVPYYPTFSGCVRKKMVLVIVVYLKRVIFNKYYHSADRCNTTLRQDILD